MKKLLFLFLLSLSTIQILAQAEDPRHEVSLILLDMDLVINSQNRESKFLLGTGLLYSYQLNDYLSIQAGVSSYETNVKDNCTFCFFGEIQEGNGFYTNKEFRLGLNIEKTSGIEEFAWLIGASLKYGRANYRAILEQEIVVFDPMTLEQDTRIINVNRNTTTRYILMGLDLGFKIYPNDYVSIAFISNISALTRFNLNNLISTRSIVTDLTANILEFRTGIRF